MKKINPSGGSVVFIGITTTIIFDYISMRNGGEGRAENIIIDGLVKYNKLLETGNF